MQKYTETKKKDEDHTQVTAFIYKWNPGMNRWEWPGVPAPITFTLEECSTEPGECLNSPKGGGTEKDLFLHRDQDAGLKYPGGSDIRCQTATTRNPHISYSVNVACEDFGGHTKIMATAPDCVQLKYGLQNGKVAVVECAKNLVNLPRDDNGNDIADAYEEAQNKKGVNPDEDPEVEPEGNANADGDGLSAYEEYRGFRCQGVHKRTSWTKRDLFIYNPNGYDISTFADISGIACHLIDEDEHNDERVLNFDYKSHHVVEEHAVDIKEESIVGTTAKNPKTKQVYTAEDLAKIGRKGASGFTTPRRGPPRYVHHIAIDPNNVAFAGYPLDKVVGHELGHAVGMKHHGGGGWGYSEEIGPTEFPKDGLCGETEKTEFWINPKGGVSSGDWDCLMRYPALGSDKCKGIFDGAFGGYECAKRGAPWTIFCTGNLGTNFNAGNAQAGDCTDGGGDCRHQLMVGDQYNND
jgi:hypothetical protein